MKYIPPTNETDAALLTGGHGEKCGLDRLLDDHLAAASDQLTPSSGFVLSVMEAIHAQASEPPPIAFPWRRVLPGTIAILFTLITFVAFALFLGPGRSDTAIFDGRMNLLPAAFFSAGKTALYSILLAACLSIATVAASLRLAGRSR